MVKKTSISILEGNGLYRMLLQRMIHSISGFVLERVYEDLPSAVEQLIKPSDMLIVDLESAGSSDVFDFIHGLRNRADIRIIACSLQTDEAFMRRAFSIGVNGYILKESSYDEFRANLMLALSGGMPMSRSVVKKLLESVQPLIEGVQIPKRSPTIKLSCDIIEEVLSSPFSLQRENLSDHLSRRVGISYHVLSLQFKREMGINLSQYVIEKKIERVKSMIRQESHSLTQIANMLDYSSVAHLSSQFRKVAGITPTEFRRNTFGVS
jgi:AraC-like DNA-binding protein